MGLASPPRRTAMFPLVNIAEQSRRCKSPSLVSLPSATDALAEDLNHPGREPGVSGGVSWGRWDPGSSLRTPRGLQGAGLAALPLSGVFPLGSPSQDSQPAAMFVNSCYPPRGFLGNTKEAGKEKLEGCKRHPVVVKDCRLPEKTHLHAVEGRDTHVEEDAVEHRHGNELWGGREEKKNWVNNLPTHHPPLTRGRGHA